MTTTATTLLKTSEAAAILGVSARTFSRLLDNRAIPYYQPSVHRLVRREDLLAYKAERDSRRSALAEMVRAAEDAGLYDEPPVTPDEAVAAIAAIRAIRQGNG